uniref:hypothetical protein n=1 Tax=Goniotrichopsis reniformis TaxID=468933 RepID=UPI001FCCD53A|nr:hypothetical protein MW428_pgp148 [Goniotrichopsis reniformis]UNJ14750.1 hypothetical protein [Goniotrichopsis reniformis]
MTPYYQNDFYCLITTCKKKNFIRVKCINKIIDTEQSFTGYTARDLCYKIFNVYSSIINPYHAAYIGRELTKAEICLLLNQTYLQC